MWKLIYILKLITGVSNLFKRIICALLLVLVSFGFSLNVSASERYQWITSTDSVTVSYDTQSVKYYNSTDGKIVDVWVMFYYTEDGAKKWVNNNRTKGICQEEKWDNFSFYLEHELVSKNSFKLLEEVAYNVNGKNIYSRPFNNNAKWNDIVHGSIVDEIHNKFIGFLNS